MINKRIFVFGFGKNKQSLFFLNLKTTVDLVSLKFG